MIKATFFTGQFYLNNRQFDISDEIANRGDCLHGFYLLKKRFEKIGVELNTQDINPPPESQFIIFNEMPGAENILNDKNNYLLILESKIVIPDNWNIASHKHFEKIFTWHDEFVDNRKYFKANFFNKIPIDINFDLNRKEKFCAMIAGYKLITHPLELYTERLKAIRWFERHHPDDFDLYGIGWAKPKYPSYKGAIKSKTEVLQKYKFSICYENAHDIPGYITEKIFDCFFAGCVPVYWGAPNITRHIPASTFIDKRNFRTYEELYSYLKNMPEKEYAAYLNEIKNFIKSDKIHQFSAEFFADTLISEIMQNG